MSNTEKKWQEAINEAIYTERDFVWDMEYLKGVFFHPAFASHIYRSFQSVWIANFKNNDVIPAERCTDFIQQVFWNIHEIIGMNSHPHDALIKRQKCIPFSSA